MHVHSVPHRTRKSDASSDAVADPEIWNRGERVGVESGEGHSPLRKNFLQILCKNNAFSCNISTF